LNPLNAFVLGFLVGMPVYTTLLVVLTGLDVRHYHSAWCRELQRRIVAETRLASLTQTDIEDPFRG